MTRFHFLESSEKRASHVVQVRDLVTAVTGPRKTFQEH